MALQVFRYGLGFEATPTALENELEAFRLDPPQGLGKVEHFWNVVTMLWGPQNKAKKIKCFERNPWTERMAVAACSTQYLGLNGASATGKTEFCAVWAIVNWLCSPQDTLVFCTSTSLKDSNRRIWGRIKSFWAAAPGLPGKLVDSMYTIRTDNGSGTFSDEQGIACIAGEKKNEKECVGKLIGAHPKRLFLIVDEMPELTEAILTAAYSNMAINPHFQMIGVGNFKSVYDTFGVFVRPKAGYGSISVEDDEWETENGLCLHFDGLRSPNITGGRDIYECYNSKDLASHRKSYSEDSSEFWRMCRSFPTPIGTADTIYTQADLVAGRAMDADCLWLREPIKISALDPSFTSGGDRAIQMIGSLGVCSDGIVRVRRDKTLTLHDDVRLSAPRDYQIARQFRDNCKKEGVMPFHAALDTTGAGSVLWSIISEEWSAEVLAVNFSGSPSELFVRANDTNTADKQFDRRVSELWWVGRDFMKYGQIRGVDFSLGRELMARKYETKKGPDGLKVCVEEKREMKKRLGFSPDEGDCFAVLLDLARARLGFLAGGTSSGMNAIDDTWKKQVERADDVYANVAYEDEQFAAEADS